MSKLFKIFLKEAFKALLLSVLPGSEDTTSDFPFYVHEDSCDHLRFNTSEILPAPGHAVHAGDLVIVGPAGAAGEEQNWVGISDDDAALNASTTCFVKEGILVRCIPTKIAPNASFTQKGQRVWFDPVTELVDSNEDTDLYLVGYVREPTDADGVMGFEKRRYAILGNST
jgi:hypothetical protein